MDTNTLLTKENGFAVRLDGWLTAENITQEEVFEILSGLYNPDENFSIEAWVYGLWNGQECFHWETIA